MLLSSTDAGQIALEFLVAEWNLTEQDREWFVVENSRVMGEIWYIVELGVAGLPDRWILQVYDTGMCDPEYTFISPMPGNQRYTDLKELPHLIAEVLVSERNSR